MHFDLIENAFLSAAVNPWLKALIGRFDVECKKDGNLLLNSLKDFLGMPVSLCPTCQRKSRLLAKPVYTVGSRLLKVDRGFMKKQFLEDPYGRAWFIGFGLMMRGVRKYGIRIPFVPAGPFEIVWNLTYRCNLRCKHCYENAGNGRLPELKTDEAKQVIDILSKLSGVGLPALSFSGGEPMARKDFFELAAYAKKHIPYVSMASNGTLITEDAAKEIRNAGIDYVEISVDGATPQTHDEFRGMPGAFERAIEGVKNCVQEGVDTCIATVLHRDNIAELDKLVSLAKELDVRFMHFNYVPTGRAEAYVELDLTPDERLHVLETVGKEIINLYLQAKEEEIKYGRSSVKVDRFFSTCPQYASVTKELSERHGERFMVEAHYAAKKGVENAANFLGGCGAGRLYCAIEPNGDIKPCVFFPTNRDTVLGNVLKDDFEEIWDTDPLLWKLRIREDMETYVVSGEEVGCGKCPDKYICGGCRARAYSYFNGDVKAPDIGCIRNKLLWEKVTNKR
ncbi:MAG: radical SAM protein [Candidatus Methanomethylicia archaeon]|nr:radical SAM protein [Candidatus Methanomethylicia archaeon]